MGTETHVNIRLAVDRVNNSILCQGLVNNKQPRLFTPGEVVTQQHGFMKVREFLDIDLKFGQISNFTSFCRATGLMLKMTR